MQALLRAIGFVCVLSLMACGGGGGNSGSKNPPIASSSSSSALSSTSSAVVSSSSSIAFSSSSSSHASLPSEILPPDYPSGTVEQLPALHINTQNNAPILTKTTYLNGNFSLSGDGVTPVEGTLEVRGRGNSTWSWPKKPLRLKLTTATELLGMSSNRHWVLLANYADKTLVRNDTAFMFGNSLGFAFTPATRHVELTLNGQYQGVYQLVEHIRIGKSRVNIHEMKVTDTDDNKITGGYLMEIDFRMQKDFCRDPQNYYYEFCKNGVNTDREKTFCVDSSYGMDPFCLDNPEDLLDPAWSAQRNYIENYIHSTEAALFGSNFADEELGYAAWLDVNSTIDYYLLNELFHNPDGGKASAYLNKPRGEKLFFGPIWDFDLALGNAGYDGYGDTEGWKLRGTPWFGRLFDDPAFDAKVKARWKALKEEGRIELIFQYAEARAVWLDKAQTRNFTKWPIFSWREWYTRVLMPDYESEVKEMIRWQRKRMEWIDEQFSKPN